MGRSDSRVESGNDTGHRRNDEGRIERNYRGGGGNNNGEEPFRRRHRDEIRDNRYDRDDRRPERERFYRERDRGDFDNDPPDRSCYRRERADSEYYSEDGHDEFRGDSSKRRREPSRFRDDGDRRRSLDRRDRRRRRSEDHTSADEDDLDRRGKKRFDPKKARKQESVEWPPSFQKKESAFAFDARSAMFYEPLSDFFYDPKSKLYYGNKKCAYFRYDESKDPPFVEVQKLTSDQVEEQKQKQQQQQEGDHGIGMIEPEKLATAGKDPAAAAALANSKPKIAIRFKTKKVKSSVPAGVEQPQPTAIGATVSKAKQQQIANIGKWNEKQAELKQDASSSDQVAPSPASSSEPPKVRTTAKGEPICMVCKRKFPNLAKLRLHEKSSELHKKNLLKLQQRTKNQPNNAAKPSPTQGTTSSGTKQKQDADTSEQPSVAATVKSPPASVYTDRAEKRRQLHGVDLGAPVVHHGLHVLQQPGSEMNSDETIAPVATAGPSVLDETNVGHQMLQKMGYRAEPQSDGKSSENNKPKTANDHLRKEWDRIEAMARKPVSRYR